MRLRFNSLAGVACLAVLLVLNANKLPINTGGEWAAAAEPQSLVESRLMPRPKVPSDSIQRGRSEHFDFYSRNTGLPMPLTELQEASEQVYTYVTSRLGARLNGRIAVLIEAPTSLCGLRGLTKIDTPSITIKAGPDTSPEQFMGVLAHELAHVVQLFAYQADARGDVVLLEGVATWAAGTYWNTWQGWPSFDAGVTGALDAGRSVLLDRATVKGLNGSVQIGLRDSCERDLFYTEWAAFVDHLVARQGLAGIGQLLVRPGILRTDDSGEVYTRADYRGVYGKSLEQLIRSWMKSRAQ
jgi:hypothetical protein